MSKEQPTAARTLLAHCLKEQGKLFEAKPLYEKVLAIRSKVLGEEHNKTAIAYSNLAWNLKEQGRYALALPLDEKALAIFRKALGEEHRNTAVAYNNLATILEEQGRYEQAQLLFEKALAICRKNGGEAAPRHRHLPEQSRSQPVSPGTATPKLGRCTSRRWPSAARCSATTTS